MSAEENKVIVRRFFNEFCNARKLEVANVLFSEGHTYTDPAIHGIPPGPEGQKILLSTYQNAFSDAHWQVEDMLVDGDKVITRWSGRGTQDGVLQGNPPIPATGKSVSVPGVWIQRVKDGKIVESWNVWDTLGMLRQLGVIPSPGQ